MWRRWRRSAGRRAARERRLCRHAPSLTVITHVDELKPVRLIEKRPSAAAVPIAMPSTVIVAPA